MLVMLFVAAGCGPAVDQTEQERDFSLAQADLACEVDLACGFLETQAQCSEPQPLGDCRRFDQEQADLCLEELEALVDGLVVDDNGCEPLAWPQSCAAAQVYDDSLPGCEVAETTAGRPIHDGQAFVLPEVVGGSLPNTPAAAHWMRAARTEYASVAAFARLATELMALGAPMVLLQATHNAGLDELRHAQLCMDLVRELSGKAYDFGRQRVVSPRPDLTLRELAVEALLEGCIGEGVAAAEAARAIEGASERVRPVLETIARDELRHATLSWGVLGWALEQDATLGAELLDEAARWLARHEATEPSLARGDSELGILSGSEAHAVGTSVVRDIVLPALTQIVERRGGVCPARAC
jgi:hypothetical protein